MALHHHAVIALDATIGCLASYFVGLAPRLIGSIGQTTSISIGVPEHISLRTLSWCNERALIGVDGTPDGCALRCAR